MANAIDVGKFTASLRTISNGIPNECARARALLALCVAVLTDAARLVGAAEAREGGMVAARVLRQDVTMAESRFESYRTAVPSSDSTDLDARIACESAAQYILDGRTADPSMPALSQPEASAVASLWNRALVLTRTLDPATPDPEALDVLTKAAASARAAIGETAGDAFDAVKDAVKDVADRAQSVAMMLAIGLGLAFGLWLLLGRK